MPLLLLDEPTLSLDPTGIEQFRRWIQALKDNNVTVLFTSHIVENALQLADRVGVIIDGRLISVQTSSEFKERSVSGTTVVTDSDSLHE